MCHVPLRWLALHGSGIAQSLMRYRWVCYLHAASKGHVHHCSVAAIAEHTADCVTAVTMEQALTVLKFSVYLSLAHVQSTACNFDGQCKTLKGLCSSG